ncbi:interferon alpha-17-like [Thalassophryne amazonica]|uniref:interferon alpha-17-like n=1 Tax=Thalassophryne amazonica TaxID=390379 RepID=UPI001470A95B|nr:interferon alpha-17-like [Thalassophryne amazonica]
MTAAPGFPLLQAGPVSALQAPAPAKLEPSAPMNRLASSVLFLLSFLLLVFSMPTCHLKGPLVQSAHNLLRDMGAPFPLHCLQHNHNISLPDSVFPSTKSNQHQCNQVVRVVYEVLEGVRHLFDNYTLPEGEGEVSWDSEKLNNFQNRLYRLLDEGKCLSRVEGSVVVSLYFRHVAAVLQQQGSSDCGWLCLRRDLLWVLDTALHNHRACFFWSHPH